MTTGMRDTLNHLRDRPSPYGAIARAIKSEVLWFGLLLATVGLLAGFRLESYPRMGFDEGYYLQLAKNLALHGEYALASPPQELDWFGLGNSSPTLGLPIALSFKLFGVGITQARLVSALYLIGAVVAVYLLMRHLYGWPAAALSAALFIVAGPTTVSLFSGGTLINEYSTIWMGRKVLGEVPALFFVLLGAWAWFRSWESESKRWSVGAGLLFGSAFVTKEQFLPMVVPVLGPAVLPQVKIPTPRGAPRAERNSGGDLVRLQAGRAGTGSLWPASGHVEPGIAGQHLAFSTRQLVGPPQFSLQ
jgi:4-amino-4-deoxy-L-arabinose transferase-like glycosyltransferase